MRKKFLFGAILTASLCLTACSKDSNEVTETSVTTTSESVSTAEKTTVTKTETEMQDTEEVAETTAKDKEVSAEEYFSSRGFAFSERYPNSPRTYEITLDMKDYKDVPNPFEGMDEYYLKQIRYFTLFNVDGCSLDFILQFNNISNIIIKDYSGSADLSEIEIPCSIDFDNYMGGDLSTVKCSEFSYNICFENYRDEYPLNGLPKNDVRYFRFENFADGVDFSFISEYPNAAHIMLEGSNTKDIDFDFIKDCKSLKGVLIKGKSIDAEVWAEILKNSSITSLYVEVEEYSSDEAGVLMKAAPTRSISYNLDDTPWQLGVYDTPTEGVVFYANLCVSQSAEEKQWECKTSYAQAYYPGTWDYHGSLVCTLTNFTEEKQKINSVKIFKDDKGILTEMPFADGNTSLEIDFEAEPNANSDFDITEEMFPFSKCETGIYKVVFDRNGEQLEQQFVINNEAGDFLTEEQQSVYNEALLKAQTDLQNSNRGSDISVQDNFFMLIYSDENEVLFKNFVIHGHEDYPYYI
ncbi:MAG: hypothetical protein K2K44_08250, partial [Oscillospiraceae bacterium]|nr:hypothetical protein [Oscillospiraceae bacterium]